MDKTTNLNEFYKSQNQSLPSISDRAVSATNAGIQNYQGTVQQNSQLLDYLKKNSTSSLSNVPATNITMKPSDFTSVPVVNIPVNTPRQAPTTPVQSVLSQSGTMSPIDTAIANIDKQEQQTREQKLSSDLSTRLFNTIPELQGQNVALQNSLTENKVPELRQNLLDLDSQIKAKQAEINKSDIELIQNMRDEERRDTTLSFVNMGKEKIQGDAQIIRALKNAEVGVLNARAQALQGNINSAIDLAKTAVEAKFAPIKSQIATYEAQLKALEPILTAQEKTRAEEARLKVEQEKSKVDYDQKVFDKGADILKEALNQKLISPEQAFKGYNDLISGKIKPSDFYTQMGVTGSDNPGIIGGIDFSKGWYATDPNHVSKVGAIYNNIQTNGIAQILNKYKSPISESMVSSAASKYGVDPSTLVAIMVQDSSLGTAKNTNGSPSVALRTNNPGNVKFVRQPNAIDSGIKDISGDGTTYAKFSSWDKGVEEVARVLSKHKAKAVYNGEFGATLEQAVKTQPANTQDKYREELRGYVKNKDYKSLYTAIRNDAAKSLQGDNQTKFESYVTLSETLPNLIQTLKEFDEKAKQKGTDTTGLLNGKITDIYAKLGKVKDPELKTLATRLDVALQAYTSAVSGAAFTEDEYKRYKSVNPSKNNEIKLNIAIIDGMKNYLDEYQDAAVGQKIGEGAKYIKRYAEFQNMKPEDAIKQVVNIRPETRNAIIQLGREGVPANEILDELNIPYKK